MKITFLYHSAFLVELEDSTILFDWHGGELPVYDRTKPLYVLESHHHEDHYSPRIFQELGMDGVWYVLGNSIRLSAKRKAMFGIEDSHVFRLGSNRILDLGPLHIMTMHSTDAGVAFLVETEGKTLFHAGDLNWWHWEGEPDTWNKQMEKDFKQICTKLQDRVVDIAFLVLDPRQERDYWQGFDWIMRTAQIKMAFSMHSWEEFWVVDWLKARLDSSPYRERVAEVRYNGQTFFIED